MTLGEQAISARKHIQSVGSSPRNGDKDKNPRFSRRRLLQRPQLGGPPVCLYSLDMYSICGQLFTALRHRENPDDQQRRIPRINFESAQQKRLCLQLAFDTVQYESVLDQILEDSFFNSTYPEFHEDGSTVMCMLCDCMQRRFTHRNSPPDRHVPKDPDKMEVQLEAALMHHRVKMNAVLARMRIQQQARSVAHLLDPGANVEHTPSDEGLAHRLPLCAWINQLKTSIDSVQERLAQVGFTRVATEVELHDERTYCIHKECSDTLVFAADARELVMQLKDVEYGELVLQDRSTCLAAHALCHGLEEDDDVLIVENSLGTTAAHVASLRKEQEGLCMCVGTRGADNRKLFLERQQFLDSAERVHLLDENLLHMSLENYRLRYIKSALVVAACTKSAVHDPVNFIVEENEDANMLRFLSGRSLSKSKMFSIAGRSSSMLKQVLKINRLQNAIYLTRSANKQENEDVVLQSLEHTNLGIRKGPAYRLQHPLRAGSSEDAGRATGTYLQQDKSGRAHGFFLSCISRAVEATAYEKEVIKARKEKLSSGKEKKERRAFLQRMFAEMRAAHSKAPPDSQTQALLDEPPPPIVQEEDTPLPKRKPKKAKRARKRPMSARAIKKADHSHGK